MILNSYYSHTIFENVQPWRLYILGEAHVRTQKKYCAKRDWTFHSLYLALYSPTFEMAFAESMTELEPVLPGTRKANRSVVDVFHIDLPGESAPHM